MESLGRNVDALSSNKDNEMSQDDIGGNPTPRRLADGVKNVRSNGYHQRIPRQNNLRSTSKQSPSSRYQSIFFGYCYSCTNFGHMAKDCGEYHKDKYNGPHQPPRSNFTRRSHDSSFINKMECFNCHKIGHMAHDCNLTWVPKQAKTMTTKAKKKVTQVCRRKQFGFESLLNTLANNTC